MLLGNMRHLGVHNLVALIDVSKTRRTIGRCGGNAIQQQKRIFIGWGFIFFVGAALHRSCSILLNCAKSQARPGLRPQAPLGVASTKSLRSYPLAERDCLLRQCAAALAEI
jgi:hypothetical protein